MTQTGTSNTSWRDDITPCVLICLLTALLPGVCGCGPTRPDPLLVVKDGGDDDEEEAASPVIPAAPEKGDIAPPVPPAGIAGAETDSDAPPASVAQGVPPFDLSMLPADTELVIYADAAKIARSSLVQSVTASHASPLDHLVSDFKLRFADLVSLKVGVSNLDTLPALSPERLMRGFSGFSLVELAVHPEISATIVLQTVDRVDEADIRKLSDEVRVGDARFFRLKTNAFNSPCVLIPSFRTLIIADETSIRGMIENGTNGVQPERRFGFARSADVVMAVDPSRQEQLHRILPLLDFSRAQADAAAEGSAAATETLTEKDEAAAGAGSESTRLPTSPGETTDELAAVEHAGESTVPMADSKSETGPTGTDAQDEIVETDPPTSALRRHVTGAAFMLNLQGGVAMSLALNCEDEAASIAVEDELRDWMTSLQRTSREQPGTLPGGVVSLIDSLAAVRTQNVAALMTAVAESQQVDTLSLPAILVGPAESAPETSDSQADPTMAMSEPELTWMAADAESQLPDGLIVEAQARWDSVAPPQAEPATSTGGLLRTTRTVLRMSDDDDEDDRRRRAAGSPFRSDHPLRILVRFSGPLARETDGLGSALVTSIQTDQGSELNFEGAYLFDQDLTGETVHVDPFPDPAEDSQPEGVQVAYHFTPPLEHVQALTRFNGTVQLSISLNRTETHISDLQDRLGKRLTNRDLARLGLSLVAQIEDDQILVRLLEGDDEQITQVTPVDTYGDPVPGVTVTRQQGTGRAANRIVRTLSFASGVPSGVGLRIVANSGVRRMDVPFRFVDLPVPPARVLPGL